ncbi:MAG: hypothetical protein GY950_29525 [bacterium]|nr:hypothetical protein [bacterium]
MLKIFLIMVLVLAFSLSVYAGDKEEKVTVKPYGFIKLDAVYETGSSSHGNFAIWAKDPGDSDGLFHLTGNQTRLGLAIKGFSFGKFKATGKLEVDFYGGGPENKAYNYMRHAFLQISDGSLTIIAGQTWDIICPLNPPTLNYPVLWGAGNIGYRRAQLRIRKTIKTGKSLFTIEAGIFRSIAGDIDGDGIDDGTAAGFPSIQGRIAGKFSLGANASLQVGISGHYGKSKGDTDFTSSSLNGDFLLVLSPKFKIIAEYFSGKYLGTYLGGIVQSLEGDRELETDGFFVSMVASLSKKVQLAAGYGVDDPKHTYLMIGPRAKNTTFFGNVVFKLSRSVKVGFEVSNWETDYLGLESQKTLRLQNSWILSF